MKWLPKPLRRKSVWVPGTLLSLVFLVYLLRWPIFGGLVKARLRSLAAEILRADVDAEAGGSLLFGIQLERVRLQPRPHSPLAEGSIRRIEIGYGLLGLGKLEVEISGADLRLSRPDEPVSPEQNTFPDVTAQVERLSLAGRFRILDSVLRLSDGRPIEIASAELVPHRLQATLARSPLGSVECRARFAPDGRITAEMTATDSPVPRARLSLDPPVDSRRPFTLETEFQKHPIRWVGRLDFDETGRFASARGTATLEYGRADLQFNFRTGTFTAEINGAVPVEEPVRGKVDLHGRVQGRVDEPMDTWTFKSVRAEAHRLEFKGLTFDRVEARFDDGTLARARGILRVYRDGDRGEAEGWIRIRDPLQFDLNLSARVSKASVYLGLLQAPLRIEAADVRVRGRLRYDHGTPEFEGHVHTGKGEAWGEAWMSAEGTGSVSSDRIHFPLLRIRGSRFSPELALSGRAERFEGGWRLLPTTLRAGGDRATLSGTFARNGAAELNLVAEGPFDWTRGFGVSLPAELRPLALRSRIRTSRDLVQIRGRLSAGPVGTFEVSLEGFGRTWALRMEPGRYDWRGRRIRLLNGLRATVRDDRARLEPVRLAIDSPPVDLELRASAERAEDHVSARFRIGGIRVRGVPAPELLGTARFDPEFENAVLDFAWGEPGGDHGWIRGRVGESLDLQARLDLPDLAASVVRRILGTGIDGRVRMELRLAGTRSTPEWSGRFDARELSIGGAPPLDLTLPFESEEGVLVLPERTLRTPYGTLNVHGRIPLLARGTDPPMDVSLRLQTRASELEKLLEAVPVDRRRWIPRGPVSTELSITGSVGAPEAHLLVRQRPEGYAFPGPVGRPGEIRLSVRASADGIRVESFDGRIGGGPFHIEGEWKPMEPGRPGRLSFSGRDLLVFTRNDARVRADPDLTLSWSGDRALLRGDIRVPLALYYGEFPPASRDGEPGKIGAPGIRLQMAESGGARLPGIPGGEKLSLDVSVKTPGEVRIENSVLGALLHANGRIFGTAAAPAVSGRITSNKGEIRLATGIFVQIRRAEIRIPGSQGAVPTLHFEGQTGKGEGEISIVVSGPLDQPGLTLQSTPPRSQQDLLAYLAFGQEPGTLTEQEALGLIARRLLARYTDDWPSPDRKDLFGKRLRLSLVSQEQPGSPLPWELPLAGTSSGTVIRTEYFLSSRFSVVAVRGFDSTWSGDLKYRLRFR